MRLIYPKIFKMNKKTLKGRVNYYLGDSSGSIYLNMPKFIRGKEFEKNPDRDDSSLENLVNTQQNRTYKGK